MSIETVREYGVAWGTRYACEDAIGLGADLGLFDPSADVLEANASVVFTSTFLPRQPQVKGASVTADEAPWREFVAGFVAGYLLAVEDARLR